MEQGLAIQGQAGNAQGTSGSSGSQGLKGSQGTRGLAIQGQAGNAQGAQGSSGNTGSQGTLGTSGSQGQAGSAQGATGGTGSQGPTGTYITAKTYAVTVVYSSTFGKNYFHLDGSFTYNISLLKGQKYVFDLSDSSNSNHPFRFSSTAEWNTWWRNSGTTYSTGVTVVGTPGQSGAKS